MVRSCSVHLPYRVRTLCTHYGRHRPGLPRLFRPFFSKKGSFSLPWTSWGRGCSRKSVKIPKKTQKLDFAQPYFFVKKSLKNAHFGSENPLLDPFPACFRPFWGLKGPKNPRKTVKIGVFRLFLACFRACWGLFWTFSELKLVPQPSASPRRVRAHIARHLDASGPV